MEKHVNLVAVLHIAFGVLSLLIAAVVFLAVVGGGLLAGDLETIAITSTVGTAVAGFLTLLALPGLIGGIGLLQRRSWARIVVMIVGALDLLNFPLGTILGAYTLWVLIHDDTARLFARARASAY